MSEMNTTAGAMYPEGLTVISAQDPDPRGDFHVTRMHPSAAGDEVYRISHRGAIRTCEIGQGEFDLAGMMAENGRLWLIPREMDRWNRSILRLVSYGMLELEPGPKEAGGVTLVSTNLMDLFFAKAREEECPLSMERGQDESAGGGRLIRFAAAPGAISGRGADGIRFSCHLTLVQERLIRCIHFGDYEGAWPPSVWEPLADQALIEDPRKTKDLRLRLTSHGANIARALAAHAQLEEEDEARRIAGEAAGATSREDLMLLALAVRNLARCADRGEGPQRAEQARRAMAFADRLYRSAWS